MATGTTVAHELGFVETVLMRSSPLQDGLSAVEKQLAKYHRQAKRKQVAGRLRQHVARRLWNS